MWCPTFQLNWDGSKVDKARTYWSFSSPLYHQFTMNPVLTFRILTFSLPSAWRWNPIVDLLMEPFRKMTLGLIWGAIISDDLISGFVLCTPHLGFSKLILCLLLSQTKWKVSAGSKVEISASDEEEESSRIDDDLIDLSSPYFITDFNDGMNI